MTKAERRKLMPKCTEFIDAMIAEFGTPAEIHAQENGVRVDWVASK